MTQLGKVLAQAVELQQPQHLYQSPCNTSHLLVSITQLPMEQVQLCIGNLNLLPPDCAVVRLFDISLCLCRTVAGVMKFRVICNDLGPLGVLYLDLFSRPGKVPSSGILYPVRCGRELPGVFIGWCHNMHDKQHCDAKCMGHTIASCLIAVVSRWHVCLLPSVWCCYTVSNVPWSCKQCILLLVV